MLVYRWLGTLLPQIHEPLIRIAEKEKIPPENLLAEILDDPLIKHRLDYFYQKKKSRRGKRKIKRQLKNLWTLIWGPLFLFGLFGSMFTYWAYSQDKIQELNPQLGKVASTLFSNTFYIVEPIVTEDDRIMKFIGEPLSTDESTSLYCFSADKLDGIVKFPIFGSKNNGMVTCVLRHVAWRTWEIYSVNVDTMAGLTFDFSIPPDQRFLRVDDLLMRSQIEKEILDQAEKKNSLYDDISDDRRVEELLNDINEHLKASIDASEEPEEAISAFQDMDWLTNWIMYKKNLRDLAVRLDRHKKVYRKRRYLKVFPNIEQYSGNEREHVMKLRKWKMENTKKRTDLRQKSHILYPRSGNPHASGILSPYSENGRPSKILTKEKI